MRNCGCNDYSRTQLLRRAAAEAGRGLPAIEPGMPMPAGTGPHAALVRVARHRARAVRVRRGEPRAEGVRAGDRRGRGAGALRARARVDLPLRRRRLAHDARADQRASAVRRERGRAWRCPPGRARRSARTARCAGTRRSAGLAELYGEGKVSVMPAIGYDDANQSHFTSRHFWEVGEVNPFGRWGWLGRYLDHHGTPDNPLQGLALGWDLQPVLAARNVPVATVAEPDNYGFWTPGVWGTRAGQDAGRVRRPRRSRRPATSASARRARRWPPPVACATSWRRSRAASPTPAGVTYPGGRLRAPPAGARGDARRRPAAEGGGDRERRLRHALEPGRQPARGPARDRRQPARVPARPRGAAAPGPRARARVERVRAPARGERLGHRPRRRRRRLRDRLAGARRDGRRVPRPGDARRGRQPAQHLGLPRRLLRAARAVARRGRGADHPERVVVHAPGARSGRDGARAGGHCRARCSPLGSASTAPRLSPRRLLQSRPSR